MKRVFILLVVVSFMAAAAVSCKSHETCPAYGSVEVEQAQPQG